ncbi:MAG TPA: HEAT repeat domain-containing protein [Gemmataceae bacterium]|nr:HEAT repeat domain-containing protein [Gemmataceae bacterium]
MIDWKPILVQWSKELMTTDLARHVDPLPESREWLGFDPATASEIEALETRLRVTLPPSYKSFLLTTNGWRTLTSFIYRLRPAGEVEYFRVENEHWVEAYAEAGSDEDDEEYYDYTKDGGSGHRAEHMSSLVQISDVGDGVYLLNPQAVTPDGEWEAWFFANWVPGAERYPSFAHLLLRDYAAFRKLQNVKGRMRRLPRLATPGPTVPRIPAERTAGKIPKGQTPETLIEQMRSLDKKVRDKAVRTFFGKLRGRLRAQRRPDLAELLTGLFYQSEFAPVRAACVAGLTELAEASPSPRPLLDALSDRDAEVVLQGIFALAYFPDPRAVEPLCRFIESGANILFKESAMSQLGEIGDPKAVPTLAKVLFNTENKFDQSFGTAGLNLGRCGPRGVEVLISALDHADARIRHAAVVGIDISRDSRAEALLKRMKDDPDAKVRQRAASRME